MHRTQSTGAAMTAILLVVLPVCLLCAQAPAAVQTEATRTPPATPLPVAVPNALTAASIQQQLKQVENDKDLDPKSKATASDLYRQALDQLRLSDQSARVVGSWKTLRKEAPAKALQLKEELASSLPVASVHVPVDATMVQLEQALAKANAAYAAAKRAMQQLELEPVRRADRRAAVGELLQTAKQELTKIEQRISAPLAPGESPAVLNAQKTLLIATRIAKQREIEALSEELPTYDTTVELLDLQRKKAARDVAEMAAMQKAWQDAVERFRDAEGRRQAKSAEDAAKTAAPILLPLAKENMQLVQLRTGPDDHPSEGLTVQIEVANSQLADAERDLKKLDVIERDLADRKNLVGIAPYLGPWLLQQRDKLPSSADLRREIFTRQTEIAKSRVIVGDLSQTASHLNNIDANVESLISDVDPSKTNSEREQIAQQARNLFTQQSQLVDDLVTDYTTYFNRLNDLSARQQELVVTADRIRDEIDGYLLWVRDSPALGLTSFTAMGRAGWWLIDKEAWRRTFGDLQRSFISRPIQSVLFILVILGLFGSRTLMQNRLVQSGDVASRSYLVPFATTTKAFGFTLGLACLWPSVVFGMGWSLYGFLGAATFSRAVGAGMMATGSVYAAIEFMRWVFSSNGLAESHFRWDSRRIRLVRKYIRWVAVVGLPLTFLLALIFWDGNMKRCNSLGRLLLIVLLIVTAFFMYRVLWPLKPTAGQAAVARRTWKQHLVDGFFIIMPLFIAVLAALGYSHTARELALRLVQSLYVALGLIVFQAIAIRWLCRVRGELALAQARLRRRSRDNARESGEGSGAESQVELEQEVNLETVNVHTRRLLQTSLGLAAFVAFWLIWSDVLPAGQFLHHVLWQSPHEVVRTVEQTGEQSISQTVTEFQAFTVADAVLALLIGLAAVAAARNVPGLIEVSLPQNVPLDTGARYALSMMIRYVIIAVGVFAVSSQIGLGWSKVQWLVAALSVGVGFGLQELVANFICGLVLLFERPIRVGDIVTVGDVTGIVTRVQIRATTIRNWDHQEYIVPNKNLITGSVLNWTLSNAVIRVVIPVGVAYGTDTRRAQTILLDILHSHPNILDDPEPLVTFEQFGDSTLQFMIRAYLPNLDHRIETIHQLHTQINDRFMEAGIEIAFPQQDLHIRSIEPAIQISTTGESER